MNTELAVPKVVGNKKESLTNFEELVGLQARFLLGGTAINPENKDVSEVKKEQFSTFEARDYSAFNNTSTYNRHEQWRQKEAEGKAKKDFEAQFISWAQEMTTVITAGENKQFLSKLKILSQITGIDLEHFTHDEAAKLYARYFGNKSLRYEVTTAEGKKTYLASDIKTFVSDILSSYQDPTSNKLNYEKLKVDLSEIQWFANIFGDTASEIVTQMLDAEAKLQTQPDNLINDANKDNRRNTLVPKEKELAGYVWEHGGIQPQPPTPPKAEEPKKEKEEKEKPAKIKPQEQRKETKPVWYYERADQPGKPRFFPDIRKVDFYDEPKYVAEALKKKFPEKYKIIELPTLIAELRKEKENNLADLQRVTGLNLDQFIDKASQIIKSYDNYLKSEFQIDITSIEKTKFVPLSNKAAELYEVEKSDLAYVVEDKPIIFISIPGLLKQITEIKEDFQRLSLPEIVDMAINNFIAHEHDHLISDLAFWYKVDKTPPSIEEKQKAKHQTGKSGVEVAKPLPSKNEKGETEFLLRGTLLNEALTAKLTYNWYKKMKGLKEGGVLHYPNEVEVLDKLVELVAKQEGISPEEAFKIFVRGKFSPKGFLELNKKLAGRTEDKAGKVKYKRKSFFSKIDALMNFHQNSEGKYNMALDYIDSIQKTGIVDRAKVKALETAIGVANRFRK